MAEQSAPIMTAPRGRRADVHSLFTRLLYKERTKQLEGHVYSPGSKAEYFLGRHTPSADLSLCQHAPAGSQGPPARVIPHEEGSGRGSETSRDAWGGTGRGDTGSWPYTGLSA